MFVVTAQDMLYWIRSEPRLDAGDDEDIRSAERVQRFPQPAAREHGASPERVQRVDENDIDIAV